MIPIFVPDSLPLWGKILIAAFVLVMLLLFIRAFIRNGRL